MTHICWSARPTGHAGCFFIRASLPPSAFLVRQPISPSFLPAGWREGRERDGRGTEGNLIYQVKVGPRVRRWVACARACMSAPNVCHTSYRHVANTIHM